MSHNRKDFPVTDRDADFEADRLHLSADRIRI